MSIIKEHFNSIEQMLDVIESRPNNSVMQNCNSSKNGTKNFTMTKSYEEARQLFRDGYTDILQEIKTGVNTNLKKTQNVNRRIIKTNVIGYAPHVPNAILGLPNSMIITEQQAQKIKAVSIVVGITENYSADAKEFVKSGVAAISVVNMLELAGYRVKLKLAFWCGQSTNEKAWGTIDLKNYREHIDLQKLCFPLAHPSMFRRFGFKWLETCPQIKDYNWSWGYGHTINDIKFIKENFLDENEFYINLNLTKQHNYNPNQIIKNLFKIESETK